MPRTRYRIESIHPHGHGMSEVRVAEMGGVVAGSPVTWLVPAGLAIGWQPGDVLSHERPPVEKAPAEQAS
jgi:hypothetical protein